MKYQPHGRSVLKNVLVTLLCVSLGVHALSLVLGQTVFENWYWVNVPFHSTIEAIGLMVALVVAALLIALENRDEGTSYNIRIAGALAGMGMIDGFHAMVEVGNTFVWFHSASTLVGGFLFSLIWLPDFLVGRIKAYWVYLCGSGVTLVGLGTILLPEFVPRMLTPNGFSTSAHVMNLSGGLMFILASVGLIVAFRQRNRVDDLLFSLHCLLFGAAALMFQQSVLWDFPWWGWHFLRLMAYGAALIFAVSTIVRDQGALLEHKATLENRVQERTSQLQQALREKETLLKEIHHRVKNNMQIISSLLSLQADQFEGPEPKEMVDDSLGRIHSMALVHDLLYQSEDLDRVNFKNYIDRLVNELVVTLSSEDQTITVNSDIPEELTLEIDTAVRCGLIVNELVTNSLQHGFNGQEDGTIFLSLSEDEGRCTLEIRDDGTGIPQKDLLEWNESLGMELVRVLVETDLRGEMSIRSNGGTEVVVTFDEADTV